jgi:hypothetical protein
MYRKREPPIHRTHTQAEWWIIFHIAKRDINAIKCAQLTVANVQTHRCIHATWDIHDHLLAYAIPLSVILTRVHCTNRYSHSTWLGWLGELHLACAGQMKGSEALKHDPMFFCAPLGVPHVIARWKVAAKGFGCIVFGCHQKRLPPACACHRLAHALLPNCSKLNFNQAPPPYAFFYTCRHRLHTGHVLRVDLQSHASMHALWNT